MKAGVVLASMLGLGFGWIAVESRYPFIFRMLDRYERDIRGRENEESVKRGLRDLEKRTGVKQTPAPKSDPIDW